MPATHTPHTQQFEDPLSPDRASALLGYCVRLPYVTILFDVLCFSDHNLIAFVALDLTRSRRHTFARAEWESVDRLTLIAALGMIRWQADLKRRTVRR
jgi:hypothetical protein